MDIPKGYTIEELEEDLNNLKQGICVICGKQTYTQFSTKSQVTEYVCDYHESPKCKLEWLKNDGF